MLFPFNTNNLLMYYKGPFNEQTLSQTGRFIRSKFKSPSLRKTFFSIFVELAQNISRHSDERNLMGQNFDKHGVGIMALYKEDGRYILKSGNFILSEHSQDLIRKCDMLNKMPNEDLRILKRKIRLLPRDQGQHGANIGLIQVILDSGYPLSVKLHNSGEEGLDFFLITIQVQSE